jgi:hypothetical protein
MEIEKNKDDKWGQEVELTPFKMALAEEGPQHVSPLLTQHSPIWSFLLLQELSFQTLSLDNLFPLGD